MVNIHNSINDDNLIYGHGVNFNIEEMVEHYGLVKDGIAEFTEMQLRDIYVQFTVGKLLYKDVKKNIEAHKDFEKKISEVKTVIVIGHSMSDVDFPYFNWIRNCLPNAKWIVSYYKDKEYAIQRLKKLNITDFEVLTTNAILDEFLVY